MKTTAVHKCANSGSCGGGDDDGGKKCDISINAHLPEFSKEANTAPGETHCIHSCGCAACGCFFCTYSCLFYLFYARSTSDTVFEVFSCSHWELHVRGTMRLTIQETDLSPGSTQEFPNIKVNLPTVSLPPIPVLNSKFVTDGTRTARVDASDSGQPVAGTIGSLQCHKEFLYENNRRP